MKKILILMSGILLCLSVVGCKEAEVVFKEKTNPVDKYINFVEIASILNLDIEKV